DGTHTVTIEWDTVKGQNQDRHAIDYLGTYNATENVNNDPCVGVSGCNLGTNTTAAIPLDPYVSANGITQLPGVLTCFGCTLSALTPADYSLPGGTDRPERLTIEFSVTNHQNPVMAWSGHIASQLDWGVGHSATSISGSPYHMRLIELDGKGGNQDRSLSSN